MLMAYRKIDKCPTNSPLLGLTRWQMPEKCPTNVPGVRKGMLGNNIS